MSLIYAEYTANVSLCIILIITPCFIYLCIEHQYDKTVTHLSNWDWKLENKLLIAYGIIKIT